MCLGDLNNIYEEKTWNCSNLCEVIGSTLLWMGNLWRIPKASLPLWNPKLQILLSNLIWMKRFSGINMGKECFCKGSRSTLWQTEFFSHFFSGRLIRWCYVGAKSRAELSHLGYHWEELWRDGRSMCPNQDLCNCLLGKTMDCPIHKGLVLHLNKVSYGPKVT